MPSTVPDMARAVGIAASRIVQESVSDARRHAPGAAIRVVVAVADQHLAVVVRNEPSTGGSLFSGLQPGFGPTGMQERVELLRGELQAGPVSDGGWLVRARLSRQEPGCAPVSSSRMTRP